MSGMLLLGDGSNGKIFECSLPTILHRSCGGSRAARSFFGWKAAGKGQIVETETAGVAGNSTRKRGKQRGSCKLHGQSDGKRTLRMVSGNEGMCVPSVFFS